MSVAPPTVYREQVSSPLGSVANSEPMQPNITGIFSHLQPMIVSQKLRSESPISHSSSLEPVKRTFSGISDDQQPIKRLRMPFPSSGDIAGAPTHQQQQQRQQQPEQQSQPPHQQPQDVVDLQQVKQAETAGIRYPDSSTNGVKVTLPSLIDALAGIQNKSVARTTVSQDYLDTYKPHDENWRFDLLNAIRKTKSTDNAAYSKPKLPSIQELNSRERPLFDSCVGHKELPAFPVRKMNFPYESNYTYLNRIYMKDAERYPECLELAQSLVLLSRPSQPQASLLVYAYNAGSRNPRLTIQTQGYATHPQEAINVQSALGTHTAAFNAHNIHSNHAHPCSYPQEAKLGKTMVQHGLPTPQLATFSAPLTYNGAHGYIPSPKSATLPIIGQFTYGTPDTSFEIQSASPADGDKFNVPNIVSTHSVTGTRTQVEAMASIGASNGSGACTRFIPITPPSVKNKSRSELMKSPSHIAPSCPRMCISCGSELSPCWRPSWSPKEGQLCNSCGLRYKKTAARCLNPLCRKIPAKGEWASMVSKGMALYDGLEAYSCLGCGYKVEIKS